MKPLPLLLSLFLTLPTLGQAAAQTPAEKVLPFDSLAFTAIDGREVDVKALRGKVVLIDFWAPWCGPCMREIFALKPLYDQYRSQGFEVVGVLCDETDVDNLRRALTKLGMTWPQQIGGDLKDPESVGRRFGITELPTSFLLGRDGKLVGRNLQGRQLETALRTELKRPAP